MPASAPIRAYHTSRLTSSSVRSPGRPAAWVRGGGTRAMGTGPSPTVSSPLTRASLPRIRRGRRPVWVRRVSGRRARRPGGCRQADTNDAACRRDGRSWARRRAPHARAAPDAGRTGMDGIADYTFVRLLGEGNHGRFYLARPPGRLPVDADHVAVKVMDAATTDDAFRRATRELRAFAAVRSPYLVRLFDAGQQAGTFFYAMEYLPMGSLAAPARPLERGEVLRAVAQAALAAHDLHEAGLVHRDVKPGNVLVHEAGAKLSDLGLAQILAPGVTITGMGSVGSVEYLDPAILRGRRPSRSTDVVVAGRHPAPGADRDRGVRR